MFFNNLRPDQRSMTLLFNTYFPMNIGKFGFWNYQLSIREADKRISVSG